jgi:signal transduction histidine kinase
MIHTGYGQMRWVILLLAIAVIVPTVCLLWFISQVVKNERLAVRQKLINFYQGQLAKTVEKTDDEWSRNCKMLDAEAGAQAGAHRYQTFVSTVGGNRYDGLIIYDATGERLYPLLSADVNSLFESSEMVSDAWQLEFIERKFLQAAELYEQEAKYGSDRVRLGALIGKSRSLAKLDRLDEAIDQCRLVAFSPLEETGDAALLVLIGNARLLMMKFTRQANGGFAEGNTKYSTLFEETFRKLISMVYTANKAGAVLPADHNLFFAQKAVEILRENSFLHNKMGPAGSRIEKLIAAEERSIRIAEHFPTAVAFDSWKADQFRRLQTPLEVSRRLLTGQAGEEVSYGLYHKSQDGSLLVSLRAESIASALSHYENTFKGSDVICRVVDDSGGLRTGLEASQGEPFVTASAGEHFPGWKIELYFRGGDVFRKAASKQIAVYTWTGVLVIVLILASGGFAGKAIGRQMRLNKLKNDFIATVSHELKTPLASMRVLVDTLLEGNYKDQQQAGEYLQLTSKENERLSRLIDNFLTFSRMERNKQVFRVARSSPAAIARAAAEAVKTKFREGRCRFEMDIREDLPDVLADRDAMVTVLVNLLDNAYKYSYDDKQIELRVFTEDGQVYFCVSDNGTGMSRRSTKKIFKRFYQVDRSLSRRGRGCGLGLSIAKFIVDAHKGSISVDSKPGEGSTFTVKLTPLLSCESKKGGN